MSNRQFSAGFALLVAGVDLACLAMTACNKQPNTVGNTAAGGNGAAVEAPPIAALPLATAAAPGAAPAPPVNALPASAQPVPFTPAPPRERYRYLDSGYSMANAFADTPPDYTVDYQGTRPWIWRARNGAYRIVERLPRGERSYYYYPGQDQPFLVRDPDYSYAYDGGRLVGVYGANGSPLGPQIAARRADDASRYYERSRELYRAAQYQRRQAAYADEWAQRRSDLRSEHQAWQEQQARNPEWRAWHDAHQPEEAAQWRQEREQRLAYAGALGIPQGSSGSPPRPDEIVRRQAAYFAAREATQRQAPTQAGIPPKAAPPIVAGNHPRASPPVIKGPPLRPQAAQGGQSAPAAPQLKTTQAAETEKAAAVGKQKEAAAAQAKAAQAAQAQHEAADQKKREAALAQARAAQAINAQKAAEQAKQKEEAAAKAKTARAADAQKAAALARQREAAAAQAKAAQAAQAEKVAADEKQKQSAAAQARLAQATAARKAADEAQGREAAAARMKAADAAAAQKASAEAKQHQAAVAAQAKAQHAAKAPNAPEVAHPPQTSASAGPDGSKVNRQGKKSRNEVHPQQ